MGMFPCHVDKNILNWWIFQCHVGFRRGVEYVLFFKDNFPRFLLAAVGTFVKNIEDMEAGDIHRRTPLSLACQKGHLQVG